MKKWIVLGMALIMTAASQAENNKTTTEVQLSKHVKEQLRREEYFAKTQSFAQGDDYNLSEHQVDPKDLESVPVIEPEYDFNMDDVYD